MSKLKDLHTLVRLLKEFEYPVSPILEYAIKEKEEKLCEEDASVGVEDSCIVIICNEFIFLTYKPYTLFRLPLL